VTARPSVRLLLLLAALVGVLAACGIPQDDEPRLIADEPEELATTQPPTNGGGNRTIEVFLIDQQRAQGPRLAARPRTTDAPPSDLEEVRALLDGVTAAEEGQYTTAIPRDTRLLDTSNAGPDTILLDLSEQFDSVAGDNQQQAFAQLVYTATQEDRSAAVRFRIEGKPISAPTEEGQRDEVRRSDYESLQPTGSSD
jgi:spore germination protein GerM